MRYYSKKDSWLLAILWGDTLLCLGLGLLFLFLPGPGALAWGGVLMLLVGIAIGALTLTLVTRTYYEITPPTLHVRSGWFHREIELDTIQQIFPTHNPLSAPALSLDRLRVNYIKKGRARFVLISPEDKLGFMLDTAASTPDLEARDGRLVRR